MFLQYQGKSTSNLKLVINDKLTTIPIKDIFQTIEPLSHSVRGWSLLQHLTLTGEDKNKMGIGKEDVALASGIIMSVPLTAKVAHHTIQHVDRTLNRPPIGSVQAEMTLPCTPTPLSLDASIITRGGPRTAGP